MAQYIRFRQAFFGLLSLAFDCPQSTYKAAGVSRFVWLLSFDLSDMGDPASSCATVGIALGVIGTRKPLYHYKVETRQRGISGMILQSRNKLHGFIGSFDYIKLTHVRIMHTHSK